jgi:hypothetical protein
MNYFIIINGIVILLVIIAIVLLKKAQKTFKKTIFKTVKITDNLGNQYYKIVGKQKNGDFQELDKFPIIKSKSLSPVILDYAYRSFLSLEEAEKHLAIFKILIGQEKYKRNIEINNL